MESSDVNQMRSGGFVIGMFGKREIAKEDIRMFIGNLKEMEWTKNSFYKKLKRAQVKLAYNANCTNDNNGLGNNGSFQFANFDKCLLNLEQGLHNNFNDYVNDIYIRNSKSHQNIQSKRNTFLSYVNCSYDIDNNTLMNQIKSNRNYILSKDESLYKKVKNIRSFIPNETSQTTNNQTNIHIGNNYYNNYNNTYSNW